MKLHKLTILASSDLNPSTLFTWTEGDPLEELNVAINMLSSFRNDQLKELKIALASQEPIEVSSLS